MGLPWIGTWKLPRVDAWKKGSALPMWNWPWVEAQAGIALLAPNDHRPWGMVLPLRAQGHVLKSVLDRL